MVSPLHMDLDEDITVKNHEVVGHLCRDLDFVLFKLLVHAEEHVVSIAVVTCGEK